MNFSNNSEEYHGESEKENPEMRDSMISYEYEGYRIRVHFDGRGTLLECIRNLAERMMEPK